MLVAKGIFKMFRVKQGTKKCPKNVEKEWTPLLRTPPPRPHPPRPFAPPARPCATEPHLSLQPKPLIPARCLGRLLTPPPFCVIENTSSSSKKVAQNACLQRTQGKTLCQTGVAPETHQLVPWEQRTKCMNTQEEFAPEIGPPPGRHNWTQQHMCANGIEWPLGNSDGQDDKH